MQAFLQSAFLQALGYAIANSLWQVAMLWLAVILISGRGKLSSARKYFVAVTAQFAGFAWFIATFQFYYSRLGEGFLNIPLSNTASTGTAYILEPSVNSFSSAALYLVIKTEQLLPYLSVAYLFMLLFLCIRFTRALYFTKQIRTSGLQKANVELRLFVKRIAAELGIKKEVRIYLSNIVKSPLTVGFLKPLILVPVASINHLTTDQLEAVLLHELAHIKRADYLINILQSVIETVLFFNPFVQLLGKFIKHERENSCDDWVLQFQYNAAMYAEALLRIAYIQTSPASLAMNAGGNKKSELLPRVKRMLNQQEKSHRYRNQVCALLLITIMLSTVAWLQPVVKNNTIAKNNISNKTDAKRRIGEPLYASVDNPLFNPIFFLTEPIQKEIDKAIDIAQQRITDAAPSAAEAVNTMVASVPPIALDELEKMTIKLDNTLAGIKTKTDIDFNDDYNEGNNINFSFSLPDSANIANALKSTLLSSISKTDLKKVTSEIKKAQLQFEGLRKEKTFAAITSNAVNLALNTTIAELEKLKTTNKIEIKENAASINQNEIKKTQAAKLKAAYNNLEKALKMSQKDKEKWIEEKLNKLLVPANDTDNNEEDDNAVSFSDEYHNGYYSAPEIYSPAAYSYSFNDSAAGINAALIIVKHNPANDNSHTKHITVEITGNNGEKKTYEFTVEVYQ